MEEKIMLAKNTKGNMKISLVEDTYLQIRERIYNNEIKPGDMINESSIAEELNISRTPVREAIRILASDDVLEIRDGVGTFVKTLSLKDIKNIFEVRKALEAVAVKSAIYNIPASKIEELEKELSSLMEQCDIGTCLEKEKFSNIDMKVHQLIFDYCDNEYIKDIYNRMSLKIKQYQFISYESLNNSKESIIQHLEILTLLKLKNLDELVVFIEKHIDWSLKSLLI